MDETTEGIQEEQAATESHEEVQQTDWKAEARKWEARAKENRSAAEELEALKAAQMSEQEKLTARAEAAEKKLKALEAEAARKQSAAAIAEAKGVPVDLLMYCADEEAMESFAEKYMAEQKTHSAPSASTSRIVRDQDAKVSTRDQFAADAAKFFNH